MALFGRDDYNWMAEAWATVIDCHVKHDEQAVVMNACHIFAQLLAKNSTGFDPQRFIENVQNQLTKK